MPVLVKSGKVGEVLMRCWYGKWMDQSALLCRSSLGEAEFSTLDMKQGHQRKERIEIGHLQSRPRRVPLCAMGGDRLGVLLENERRGARACNYHKHTHMQYSLEAIEDYRECNFSMMTCESMSSNQGHIYADRQTLEK